MAANNLQSDSLTFSTSTQNQFAKYATDFSIETNLNCTDIDTGYDAYKGPLCNAVKMGFIELLALRVISLPLEIGLCILGIRFVLRNKVDVPKYTKPQSESKKSKKKGKKKKGKKDGEDGEESAGSQDDDDDDDDESGEEGARSGSAGSDNGDNSDGGDDAKDKKGCFSFLCCCCGGKKKAKGSKASEGDSSLEKLNPNGSKDDPNQSATDGQNNGNYQIQHPRAQSYEEEAAVLKNMRRSLGHNAYGRDSGSDDDDYDNRDSDDEDDYGRGDGQ